MDLVGSATIGRLDINSHGLLLFTQDGRLAKRVIGESSTLEKEYIVYVIGMVNRHVLDRLRYGLILDGIVLKPAIVDVLNVNNEHNTHNTHNTHNIQHNTHNHPKYPYNTHTYNTQQTQHAQHIRLRFVLKQGRKRQIRRMCELVNLKVIDLQRIRVGNINLGTLPRGKWRYMHDDEYI